MALKPLKAFRRGRKKSRRARNRNAAASDDNDSSNDDLGKKKNLNDSDDDTDADMTEADLTNNMADDDNATPVEPDPNELLHEVMSDNLDLMLEIVMQIREDEDFAKNLYADCPRLQHLLDQNPDLRPVFEDPHMIRINFEQVYKKAGGVLPEDKPSRFKRAITCIVQHPLFKVFRFLLLIKKLYNCIMSGGFNLIRNCCRGLFCPNAVDVAEAMMDTDGDALAEAAANKEILEGAAQHMEDPEVREQMRILLENDPDDLEEAIENDPELRALREANPLCAELMNDPETMRILVDPDNLRALAECPDMIEADFADPDWMPPDVEGVQFDDELVDADGADGAEDVEGEEEDDDDEGFMDEYERGDATDNKSANKKQSKKKQQQKKKDGQQQGGGFFSTLGTGLVDYLAAETVGMTTGDLMGDDGDFEDLVEEEAVDEVAETAEDTADNADNLANTAAAAAEFVSDDNVAENLENTMDNVEEVGEKQAGDNNYQSSDGTSSAVRTAENAALGGVAALTVAGMAVEKEKEKNQDKGKQEEDEDKDDEDEPKKGRLRRFRGAVGGAIGALGTAAKEMAATAVLGEDLAEDLVEKIEESDEEEDEDDKDEKKKGSSNKKGGDENNQNKSRKGFLGKNKKK